MEQTSIGEYFNSIKEAVSSVFIKNSELKVSGRGRQVLKEVQKIYPDVNPDTCLRAYRLLRSSKQKDMEAEQEWRNYFRNNSHIIKHSQ